jgi:anti-sigma B factor antagonist
MRRGDGEGAKRRKSGEAPAMTEGVRPSWESLTCRTEERGEAVVLHPAGEVDLATVSSLWSMMKSAGEGGRHVIVALNEITYIDSTGIKALLDVHRLLRQRSQRLLLADPTSMVRKVIEITALEKVIPVYASLEEAVQSLQAPAGPEQGA